MGFLTEQVLNEIRELCEAKGDEKYWPLVKDYFRANSDAEKRRAANDIAGHLLKDLKKEAQSLENKGMISDVSEIGTAIAHRLPNMLKSFWESNQDKVTETAITGFQALAKKAITNYFIDRGRKKKDAIDKAGPLRDVARHVLRPQLGDEEKRAVRQAILKVLKNMERRDPDAAKFIRALIAWDQTRQPSAAEIARMMKKTPDKVIKVGKLGDVIQPGPKGMGFKRGSLKDAMDSLGMVKPKNWAANTQQKFALSMCKQLMHGRTTAHLFVGLGDCKKVLGIGESVAVESVVSALLGVPAQYLTEESASDMMIRLCQECMWESEEV